MAKYSDRLLNLIPVCPEYVKLEDLVGKVAAETGEPAGRVREAVKKTLQRWLSRGVVSRHPQLQGYYCKKQVSTTAVLDEKLEEVGDAKCFYEVRPPVVKVIILHPGDTPPDLVSVPLPDMTPQLWMKLREKCLPLGLNK